MINEANKALVIKSKTEFNLGKKAAHRKLSFNFIKSENKNLFVENFNPILSENTKRTTDTNKNTKNHDSTSSIIHNKNTFPALSDNFNLQCEQKQEKHQNYIVKKINIAGMSDIQNLIKKKFTDVNDFLVPDENIIIGRKFINQNENFKNIADKKPYEIIGNQNLFKPKNRFAIFKKKKNRPSIDKTKGLFGNFLIKFLQKEKTEDNHMEELLTERRLENLFEEKKKFKSEKNNFNNKKLHIWNNKNNNNINNNDDDDSFCKNIESNCKEHVKLILKKQEKILEKKEKMEKTLSNISKHLSFKTNKSENQLLMNSTDGFRVKKEIRSALDQSAEKNTKYGLANDWMFSLRKTPQLNIREVIYSNEMRNFSPRNNIAFNNKKAHINFNFNSNNGSSNNNDNKNVNTNNLLNSISTLDNKNNKVFSLTGQIRTNLASNNGSMRTSTENNFFSSKNKSSNHYTNNFSNTNDCKYRIMKYNNTYDNDMWVTVNEKQDNNNHFAYKVRKPFSDPVPYLDNFIRCFSIEKKMEILKIKKEDLNKINNMKVGN